MGTPTQYLCDYWSGWVRLPRFVCGPALILVLQLVGPLGAGVKLQRSVVCFGCFGISLDYGPLYGHLNNCKRLWGFYVLQLGPSLEFVLVSAIVGRLVTIGKQSQAKVGEGLMWYRVNMVGIKMEGVRRLGKGSQWECRGASMWMPSQLLNEHCLTIAETSYLPMLAHVSKPRNMLEIKIGNVVNENVPGERGIVLYSKWQGGSNDQKVKYTAGSFVGKALTWWNSQIHTIAKKLLLSDRHTLASLARKKFMMIQDFCPSHEMQKLESELWNHVIVGAGHAVYTDRFHELARLVPHLVTPESRMIERYVYVLALQIRGMVAATEPKTMQKAVQISGALTDEAVRNGSIKKVKKRGNVGETRKDKNDRDDNKRTRTGNVFATTVNPVGREDIVLPPVITKSTTTTAPSTIPKAKGITFRDAGESTTKTPTSVSSSCIAIKDKVDELELQRRNRRKGLKEQEDELESDKSKKAESSEKEAKGTRKKSIDCLKEGHKGEILSIDKQLMEVQVVFINDLLLQNISRRSFWTVLEVEYGASNPSEYGNHCQVHLCLDGIEISPEFNLLSYKEYSKEEEEEAMALTVEQYMSKTQTDFGSGVARPKINNKDQFELKGQFLKELQEREGGKHI
ncbi:hypothetical protein Tco_0163834 [Tanacetum coccineum]